MISRIFAIDFCALQSLADISQNDQPPFILSLSLKTFIERNWNSKIFLFCKKRVLTLLPFVVVKSLQICNSLFLFSPLNCMHNGKALVKKVLFEFCFSSIASKHIRNFLNIAYFVIIKLKKKNPILPNLWRKREDKEIRFCGNNIIRVLSPKAFSWNLKLKCYLHMDITVSISVCHPI